MDMGVCIYPMHCRVNIRMRNESGSGKMYSPLRYSHEVRTMALSVATTSALPQSKRQFVKQL